MSGSNHLSGIIALLLLYVVSMYNNIIISGLFERALIKLCTTGMVALPHPSIFPIFIKQWAIISFKDKIES